MLVILIVNSQLLLTPIMGGNACTMSTCDAPINCLIRIVVQLSHTPSSKIYILCSVSTSETRMTTYSHLEDPKISELSFRATPTQLTKINFDISASGDITDFLLFPRHWSI
eukprot:Lithocolla_globosa_v1_NODE_165_length_5553_cov_13.632479.p9 type:complete len:111 gc:universal NODE_165_length_5553_cov_13.632479:380-712(+)